MKTCDSIRAMLPLSAGGDLDPRERERVSEHLSGCASCREEEGRFKAVISTSRAAYSERLELTAMARNRIAISAAELARSRSWASRLLLWNFTRHPGLMATAAALLVAVVAMPVMVRDGRNHGVGGGNESLTIEVRAADDGAVRLAWSDGDRGSYTVYKSHDPRLLTHAESHQVAGNIWTDTDPESARFVYYRIE
jgi:anti-sigma factor RsiW